MKKYLSRRKKKTILTALALGLCLLTPWHRAEAVTSYTTPTVWIITAREKKLRVSGTMK